MGVYIAKGQNLTEGQTVAITTNFVNQLKSVTVNVRAGQAEVHLGPISGQVITMVAGESMSWSTLAASDYVEAMTVTAVGAGASVLVAWAHT